MLKAILIMFASVFIVTVAQAQSLEGTVYVTLGSGEAQLVRGGEVFLVCASSAAEAQSDASLAAMKKAGDASREAMLQLMRSSPSGAEGVAQISGASAYAKAFLPRLADAAYLQLASGQRAATRTTVEGRYEFRNVTPGRYFVVTRHKTDVNDVLWRIPVVVAEGAETIDLSNFNAINLREALAMSAAEDTERAADQLIMRFFSNQRSSFLQGRIQVARQAADAPLPPDLLQPLACESGI